MSQLVPNWNFGWDYQYDEENQLYLNINEANEKRNMVNMKKLTIFLSEEKSDDFNVFKGVIFTQLIVEKPWVIIEYRISSVQIIVVI